MSFKDTYVSEIQEKYLDRYGMVGLDANSPNHETDNGLFFSAIHVVLCHTIIKTNMRALRIWYTEKVRKCYMQVGNITRKPGNTEQQQQWDDFLGLAIACMALNITDIPREILKYGLLNLFFYNTDGQLKGEDFLGRFPQVWVMMFAAAFPIMRWIVKPLAWLISLTMKKEQGNSSGNNLIFMYLYGMKLLGMKSYSKKMEEINILENFKLYFKAGHPFISLLEENIGDIK